jgi:hypothetical protein
MAQGPQGYQGYRGYQGDFDDTGWTIKSITICNGGVTETCEFLVRNCT